MKRFETNGILFDQVDGIGAVPDTANIAYKGFIAFMKPSVYLSLVPPLPFSERNEFVKDVILSSKTVGMGFLDVDPTTDPPRIIGHEGRNRTQVILEAFGDTEIPVAIFFAYGIRARDIEEKDVARLSVAAVREKSTVVIDGPLFEEFILMNIRRKLQGSTKDTDNRNASDEAEDETVEETNQILKPPII